MTIQITANSGEVDVGAEDVFVGLTAVVAGARGIDFAAGSDPGLAVVAGTARGTTGGADLDGNDQLVVLGTGSVLGQGAAGADAIRVTGADNLISISGSVFAEDAGIITFGSATNMDITITETGVVQGGSNGRGADAGAYSAAVAIGATDTTLVNNGDIIGEFNADNGQRIAVLNASVNDGDPNGFNIGLDADLDFFNTGFVRGDVLMGAGEDLYDARGGGIVNGLIDMGAGDDVARGGEGDEMINGGDGNDDMSGGSGMDSLNGGANNDTIAGNDGSDVLNGGNGEDSIIGGAGDDEITGGSQNDVVRGSTGNDDANGGGGNDTVSGGGGDDVVKGGKNKDEVRGGRGDDRVEGNGGKDTLEGGNGDDTMEGGGGGDLYVFGRNFGEDEILDFSGSNREKIDISAVNQIANFNDLVNNHLSQAGADAVITVGDDSITLVGFNGANLDAGDFIF